MGSGDEAAVVSQRGAEWIAVGQAVRLWHKPEALILCSPSTVQASESGQLSEKRPQAGIPREIH